jgi:CMP-N,N'-diacetyllegionaminic acid synthase
MSAEKGSPAVYDGHRIVSITCARAGSKGVPGKNLRPLLGKPLIAHTIEAAQASRYLDERMVSTDCPEIAAVAEQWGAWVPFLRPAKLAQDATPQIAVIRHVVTWLIEWGADGFDAIVTLQPTTPMRTSEQIDAAIELFFREQADCVLGVAPAEHSPYWMFTVRDRRLHPLINSGEVRTARQSLPPVYRATGSVYVNRTHHLLRPGPTSAVPLWELGDRVVPLVIEDPLAGFDLDTELDFVVLEALLRERESLRVA